MASTRGSFSRVCSLRAGAGGSALGLPAFPWERGRCSSRPRARGRGGRPPGPSRRATRPARRPLRLPSSPSPGPAPGSGSSGRLGPGCPWVALCSLSGGRGGAGWGPSSPRGALAPAWCLPQGRGVCPRRHLRRWCRRCARRKPGFGQGDRKRQCGARHGACWSPRGRHGAPDLQRPALPGRGPWAGSGTAGLASGWVGAGGARGEAQATSWDWLCLVAPVTAAEVAGVAGDKVDPTGKGE